MPHIKKNSESRDADVAARFGARTNAPAACPEGFCMLRYGIETPILSMNSRRWRHQLRSHRIVMRFVIVACQAFQAPFNVDVERSTITMPSAQCSL
jgi:hypothetical protein